MSSLRTCDKAERSINSQIESESNASVEHKIRVFDKCLHTLEVSGHQNGLVTNILQKQIF